jgi:hypothetical protein
MKPVDYVAGSYQHGEQLLEALGSFWHSVFMDADVLQTYFKGYTLEAAQAYQSYLESVANLSRAAIQPFHRDNWHYLTFLESEVLTDLPTYRQDGIAYGAGYQYGVRYSANQYSAACPDKLVSAAMAFDRIISPATALTAGVDFLVDPARGVILFKNNPFEMDIKIVDKFDGQVADREGGLWLYAAKFDYQALWANFGYALGVYMESGDPYKGFIEAFGGAFPEGPSVRAVERIVCALTGAPLVKENTETVEEIKSSADHLLIVTDKHVYRARPKSTCLVSTKETLSGGTPLTDAVEIIELNAKTQVSAETIPALALGPDLLVGEYTDPLVFENKEYPWYYAGSRDGKNLIQFAVGGNDADVQEFWSVVHGNCGLQGTSLGEYVASNCSPGTRLPSLVQPTGSAVNPLQFILTNLLKNNLFLVKIKPMLFPAEAPGSSYFHVLRRILPPHVSFLVLVELSPGEEEVDTSATGEAVEQAFASVLTDSYDVVGNVGENIGLRLVPAECKE